MSKETEQKDDENGFGILHRNQFFSITPFTGWAFIYAAEKRVEIIGWYLIILIFFTITIVKSYQLFQYHASQPTKTKVVLISKTSDLYLPNITIQLSLPLALMLDHLPKNLYLNPASPMSSESMNLPEGIRIIHDFICRGYSPLAIELEEFREVFDIQSRKILEGRKEQKLMVQAEEYSLHSISDTMVLKSWMEVIDEAKKNLMIFWDKLFTTKQFDKEQLIMDLNSLTYGVLRHHYNDSFYKLLLLETRKGDQTGLVKDVYNIKEAPPLNEIFVSSLSNLNRMIHIEAEPQPEIFEAFDWSVDLFDSSLHLALVKLRLVPKSQTKSMKFKIYSFTSLFLRMIIESLELILEQNKKQFICTEGYNEPTFEEELDEWRWSLHRSREYYGSIELQIGPNKRKAFIPRRGEETNISVVPLMHFSSQIDDCHNSTMDGCIDDCLIREYLEQCQCIIHSLAYLNVSLEICENSCASAQHLEYICFDECSRKQRHACNFFFISETSHIQFERFIDKMEHEESIFNLEIPETQNFAKFIEEYELTTETLFSHLGGTLEFYSGINIMGVVHLFVFILVMILDKIFIPKIGSMAEKHPDDANDTDLIEQQIQAEMAKLENTKDGSLSSWLIGNRFFKQTPMSGFSYIATADKLWEKCFWYFVILCFLIGGSLNIHNAYKSYAAKPTHTIFVPTSSLEGLSIPNLTLDLGLPCMELGTFKLSSRYNPSNEYSLENLWNIYDNDPYGYTGGDIYDRLYNKLEGSIKKPLELFGSALKSSQGHSFSSPEIFEEWQQSLKSGRDALETVKQNQNEMTLFEIQKIVPELVEAPMQNRDTNLPFKVFLLEALKTGVSPKELMHKQFYFQHSDKQFQKAMDVLIENGWTAQELIVESISSLQKIVHVELDEKDGTVFLSDCSLDLVDSWLGDGLKLQFEISVPRGRDQLHIRVFSYMDLWLKEVFKWSDTITKPKRKESKQVKKDEKSPENLAMISFMVEQNLKGSIYDTDYIDSHISIRSLYSTDKSAVSTSFTSLPIYLKPLSLMTANMLDCVDESLEWCIKKCILESHYSQCQCYPWHLSFTIDKSKSNVCDIACNLDVTKQCAESCNLCITQMHSLSSHFAQDNMNGDLGKWLFEINITTSQAFYPKLMREYEISGSAFLSNLGALLDFWCGINVIAILHLLLYIFKQLYYSMNRANKAYESKRSTDQKLKDIQESRIRIQLQLTKLKQAASNNSAIKNEIRKSPFDWLWQHNFYEETDMTGFSFIANARHHTEAVFWWTLIILFFGITINNVSNAFKLYNSNPIQTRLSFSSIMDEIELGNMTLTIKVPLMDLSPINLLYGPSRQDINHKLDDRFQSAPHYFMCLIEEHVSDYGMPNYKDAIYSWRPLLSSDWNLQSTITYSEGSTIDLGRNWQEPLDKASKNVLDFFDGINSVKVPRKTEIDENIQENFNDLLNEPLSRFSDAQKRFMVLESLKTGKHPKTKLAQIIKERYSDYNVGKWLNDDTEYSPQDLLNGISPRELFSRAEQDITKMVHINTSSTKVTTSFIDWEYSQRAQIVKFQVEVPAQANKITFEMHFIGYEWSLKILDTFRQFFLQKNLLNEATCYSDGYDRYINIDEIIRIHERDIYESLAQLDEGDEIVGWLETGQGTTLIIPSDTYHHYLLKPTTNFYSLTNECAPASYSHCVSNCIAELHATICGCIPWNLSYLHQDQQIEVCSGPCSLEKHECEAKCEKATEHPCKRSLYGHELNEDFTYDFLNDLPRYAYSFTIEKQPVTYAVFTENYYFTIGSFVTHLAGLFDLFMGINLLSFIHIIVFLIKQVSLLRSKRAIVTPKPANQVLRIQKLEEEIMTRFKEIEKRLQEEKLEDKLVFKG